MNCRGAAYANEYRASFDNPAIEDALRRIECGTASEELLIRQANMTDYINVCRAAVGEKFDQRLFEKGGK